MNLNTYADCNPFLFIDPSGLWCEKATCCCCAEDIVIKNSKKAKSGFGWDFTAAIQMDWKFHDKQEACSLEWWEWFTITDFRVRDRLKTWLERISTAGSSKTFKNWFKKTRKPPCEGKEEVPIEDNVRLVLGKGVMDSEIGLQDLYIGIKVISSPGCVKAMKCTPPKFRVAYMHITIKNKRNPKTGKAVADNPPMGEPIKSFPAPEPGNPPRGEWPDID